MDKGFIVKPGYKSTEVCLFKTTVHSSRAEVSIELARFMVAYEGKTPTIQLRSPKEIADRAMELSDLLFTGFEERGWTLEVPAPVLKEEEKS